MNQGDAGGLSQTVGRQAVDRARLIGAVVLLLLTTLLIAMPAGVLVTSFVVSPDDIDSGAIQLTPPCPSAEAGQACASCGLTRSFCAMSHLQPQRAWAYHHGGPVLYLATWGLLVGFVGMFVKVLREELLVALRRRDRVPRRRSSATSGP